MRLPAIIGLIVCAAFGSSPAFAQTDRLHITPEEHAACDNDAARLCSSAYPDENKLLRCMRSQREQLTPQCSDAFDAGLRKRHLAM